MSIVYWILEKAEKYLTSLSQQWFSLDIKIGIASDYGFASYLLLLRYFSIQQISIQKNLI